MSILRISLLGRLTVCGSGQTWSALGTQKAQELFCYLLINRNYPHNREFLASLLWENISTAQSKQYFRKTLWQLQSILDKHTSSSDLLLVEADWIQVNSKSNFWLDLVAFEGVFTSIKNIRATELTPDQVASMEQVIELYRGDLLQGWYQEWCLWERERFQHMHLTILDKLVEHCISCADCEKGIAFGTQILRYDQARECTHRQLMQLYALSGDRIRAVRQYKRCMAVLDKELGVEPAASTTELYRKICSDTYPAISLPVPLKTQSLNTLLPQLRQLSQFLTGLQMTLTELQAQTQEQLHTVNGLVEIQPDNSAVNRLPK